MSFTCPECFDTETIDRDGAEIACPYCPVTVKLSGLSHGLGLDGAKYATATSYTASTITFQGTRAAILADVREVLYAAEDEARAKGKKGRNYITSGPTAIAKKVREALR